MHLYFHESEIGKNFPLSYCGIKKYTYLCTRKRERCHSSVGRAKRSGRRGRAFESPHSDKAKGNFLEYSKLPFISIQSLEQNQDGYVIKHNLL